MQNRYNNTDSGRCCIVFAFAGMFAPRLYAQSLVPVKFRLDFRLSGPHLPYIWALEKGYYAEEGLDVTIKEGAGAQQTINLILQRKMILLAAIFWFWQIQYQRVLPSRRYSVMFSEMLGRLISFADANLRQPRDLMGKTVAVIADHKVFLELLLRTNNVPPEKVTMRVVNVAVRNTVFAERKVDAFISQVLGSPMDFVARAKEGKNPQCILCCSAISA